MESLSLLNYQALEANYRQVGQPGYMPVLSDDQRGYNMAPTYLADPTIGFWRCEKQDMTGYGQPTGWKLHISVKDEALSEAYGTIADVLMEANVGQFKVVAPEMAKEFGQASDLQSGKMVTIYDFEGGPDLEPVMQELERRLDGLQMRMDGQGKQLAGPAVKHDRKIEGSNYLYYRNDLDENGSYVANSILQEREQNGQTENLHNLSGKPDKWGHVSIQRDGASLYSEIDEVTHRRAPSTASMPWMEEPTREIPVITSEMLARNAQETKLSEALYTSLSTYMPQGSILGVAHVEGAYQVTIPSTLPRSAFGSTGLQDVQDFARTAIGDESRHVITIPEEKLNSYYHIDHKDDKCPVGQAMKLGREELGQAISQPPPHEAANQPQAPKVSTPPPRQVPSR